MTQAQFSFEPIQEDLEQYFILHSGVAEQFRRAEILINNNELTGGTVIFVCGPKGCGKSHFIKVLLEKSVGLTIPARYFLFDKFGGITDATGNQIETAVVISLYQDMKSSGGVLIFEAEGLPATLTKDPHLLSRLKSGEIFTLNYPLEEELRPVLRSLLERHHLRLKELHINQILNQVPAIPEYFEMVSKALIELLPKTGKIKSSSIREVVETRI